MKAFKYTVWIILLFIIQTVVMNYITPLGLHMDIVLPFVIVTAVREDNFRFSTAVSIICAVAAGALCGRNFSFCVLFYTYLGTVVFNMRKQPHYMPDFARCLMWTVPAVLISEIISYLLLYHSFGWLATAFLYRMLPSVVYTIIGMIVLYPLMHLTLYKGKHGKKQFIVK